MKITGALALSSLLVTASCVHVEKTSDQPIQGQIVHYRTGRPIPGAQVWALFKMPGGLVSPYRYATFGPAISDSVGKFTLRPEAIAMTQTGTIYDGSTNPYCIVIGPRGTAGCLFPVDAGDPKFKRIKLGEGLKDPEAYIELLPEEKRSAARAALR